MHRGTKIFLIRHAESEGNIYRRAHGHHNGLVTARGYKQLELLEERFENEKVDAVYSSDLKRTMTTAAAVATPRDLQINPTAKLREVKMGVWEDNAWGDIEYKDTEMNRHFGHDPAQWIIEGGEAYSDVQKRMYDFIIETASLHTGECIVFVSHGFAIRSLMCYLKKVPSERTREVPYCDNTAVSLLHYESDELALEYYGDNSHLSSEISTLARQTWWRKDSNKKVSENLRFMPLNEVASEQLLRIFRAKAGERALVDMQYAAYRADEPVGILGIDTRRDVNNKIGWISYMHIIPHCRNKTYGTQLLGLAVSDFRKLRREKVRIELPSGNLATNFLTKFGFSIVDMSDTVCLMEKDIRNW